MEALIHRLFGAYAQVAMGVVLLLATVAQTVYWTAFARPSFMPIFLVSMEALAFAAYAIIATGFAVIWLDKRTPDADLDESE